MRGTTRGPRRQAKRCRTTTLESSSSTIVTIALLCFVTCPFAFGFTIPLSPYHGSINSPSHRHHRSAVVSLNVSPIEVVVGLGVGFAGWLYIDGADDRNRNSIREIENARYEEYQAKRAKKAYVEPKEFWTEAQLAKYDGTQDDEGPILFAANGIVFNVWKGRNFYGPGGEYHIFAGRDATRLLARTKVEEETEEEASKPLSIGERAALAGWIFTFKGKYDIVGKLEGFDSATTSMS